MSQYILNVDSTYRDQKQYPYSTEFGVIVNPTPGNSAAGNNYSVTNIIYSRFQWPGTTTTTVPNDTVVGNFKDFTTSTIELDPANASPNYNFYFGCQFVLDANGVGSVILIYNPATNSITLLNPISKAYYDPSNTGYKIINPSNHPRNEILLLGSNLYVNTSNEKQNPILLLKSGPDNSLFVQNVTKGWVLPIHSVLGNYRIATFAVDMPSYDNGDLFQVRKTSNILQYTTLSNSVCASIETYQIPRSGTGYGIGNVVTVISPSATTPATYTVTAVDCAGCILSLSLIDPGSGYSVGIYTLSSGANSTARLYVESVQSSITVQPSPIIPDTYILYVPSIEPIANAFFTVTSTDNATIFFSASTTIPITANQPVELMVYRTRSTGLTMPLVSYKQPVCYDVSLINLILPNQPVYGYNVLPTFFPYFLIELYNTSIPGSNMGVLYSNNPNTDKVTFFCPVGNPRNPLIVSYLIVLSSTQVQTIKWTPTDDFYFRVLLPNGETLRYNFDLDANESDIITGNISAIATNNFHFWGELSDRRISATFSFRLK
jgi:hypothetical protein